MAGCAGPVGPAREGGLYGRARRPAAGEAARGFMKSNPSVVKRQKEKARQDRAREKEARRQERRREQQERGTPADGEDPDIAGIVPGPQPPPEE